MYLRWAVYVGTGVAVFFLLRFAFKRARLDPQPHDKIWTRCFLTPEGWILGILLWPFLALASVFWFGADLLHAQGKKEIEQARALEAQRDKRYDGLDLMQKIDRLKAESEASKKMEK